MFAPVAAARTTLDQRAPRFQCAYKANLAAHVVSIYHASRSMGIAAPTIVVRFDSESTDRERAMVFGFMEYAKRLAEGGNLSAVEAGTETLDACMNQSRVELEGHTA